MPWLHAGLVVTNKRKAAIAVVVSALLLSLGFLSGFFTAKHLGTTILIKHGPPPRGSTGSVYNPVAENQQELVPVSSRDLRQLPSPTSPEGRALIANPDTGVLSVTTGAGVGD